MDSRLPQTLDALAAVLTPVDELASADETATFAAGGRSRHAAVAALLKPGSDDRLELLLIRRAERAGDVWSGHVALPGGRREPTDPDLVTTAVRETSEEIGVELGAPGGRLLGALPQLHPMSPHLPQLWVQPLVWSVGEDITPGTSDEVAAVRWVTLEHLRDDANRIEHRSAGPDGVDRPFPAIALDEDVLWGMTHRIVHMLLEALDRAGASA